MSVFFPEVKEVTSPGRERGVEERPTVWDLLLVSYNLIVRQKKYGIHTRHLFEEGGLYRGPYTLIRFVSHLSDGLYDTTPVLTGPSPFFVLMEILERTCHRIFTVIFLLS